MARLSDSLKRSSNTNTVLTYTAGYPTRSAHPTLMLYIPFLKDLFGPDGFLNAADAFELGYYGLFDPMLGTFPKRAFIFLSSIYVASKDTFF